MIKQEILINGSSLSIETGKVARQSAGSVIVTHGETSVLVAVNAAKEMREDIDFFPLQVEYRVIVVSGSGRGSSLGFPTANFTPVDKNQLIPMSGVYFISCLLYTSDAADDP